MHSLHHHLYMVFIIIYAWFSTSSIHGLHRHQCMVFIIIYTWFPSSSMHGLHHHLCIVFITIYTWSPSSFPYIYYSIPSPSTPYHYLNHTISPCVNRSHHSHRQWLQRREAAAANGPLPTALSGVRRSLYTGLQERCKDEEVM